MVNPPHSLNFLGQHHSIDQQVGSASKHIPELATSLRLHHKHLRSGHTDANPNKESLGDLPAATKICCIEQGARFKL